MNITVFRIDERLIHGQIVTAWLQYADAKQIVVVDDNAAKNSLRQKLLRMATPKDIKLQVLTIADAIKILQDDTSSDNTLLLAGLPSTALQLANVLTIKNINIGNQNMKKGKSKILDNFWLFDEDISAFKQLEELGFICEFRTVPSDHSQNTFELIRKANL